MRSVAYVSIKDPDMRARTVESLDRRGYAVIEQPTGFDLIHAIADIIEGHQSRLWPALIVVDAWSPGCAGTTIAEGLRDLGITIPIVLITAPGERVPITADEQVHIVESVDQLVPRVSGEHVGRASLDHFGATVT